MCLHPKIETGGDDAVRASNVTSGRGSLISVDNEAAVPEISAALG